MPIRAEAKRFYPEDWTEISARIRFERAGGRCEQCGRPHGTKVPQLADGTWRDPLLGWRTDDGLLVNGFDFLAALEAPLKKIVLAAAHLDHDPRNSGDDNLRALCGRCHLRYDRTEHLRRRRWYRRIRSALGDLFLGTYPELPLPGLMSPEMTNASRYKKWPANVIPETRRDHCPILH